MASYSRNELVNKFQKELEDWNNAPAASALKAPKDTTHIQMASLDEMMSAYGYVPRRVPQYPNITDGRFGYQSLSGNDFISLEDAVSYHNNAIFRGNPFRKIPDRLSFALQNRIVEQVSVQRDKSRYAGGSGIKSQKLWVKFYDI